jgi:outer membrane protein OmpA-like peptidoglycan-associated protein
MRLTALAHGATARRLATSAALAALIGLALTGCASDDEDAGTPFTQALAKNYADLSTQAAALPAPQEEGGFFSSLDVFGLFSGGNPNQELADAFKDKADSAASGDEPAPEPAPADAAGQALGARLSRDLAAAKDQAPVPAARAQTDYDCWVLASAVPSAASMAGACRASLDASLAALEGGARPIAPVSAPIPAPVPQPVQSAPIAPVQAPVPAPAQAQASSDFTVYFDFDSWTLTAEDLKVITDAINTARTGGQSHITVVGHTDTSGPADYNQKLSVRRANVVVEALVDMGARRAAITASGVGENDLAVQTGDDVKEEKNRRSVITLQP